MTSTRDRIQVVVFMRHGVAQHNLRDPRTGQTPNLYDPALLDPSLVLDGKVAALHAGETIRTWWHTTQLGERIDLIVTSPLTRCIQTACYAFLPNGQSYEADQAIPLVCQENVREAHGKHYPDQRRPKSLLEKHWRAVEFDANMTEEDTWWKSEERESWDNISQRGCRFLSWLVTQPKNNIVVVSHGVWMEALFRAVCPRVLGERRVHNCDAYAFQCVSRDGRFLSLDHGVQIAGRQDSR